MTVVEILRAAREKISDPAHWTTRDYARDHRGLSADLLSNDAFCWCALGALWAASEGAEVFIESRANKLLLSAAGEIRSGFGIVEVNDTLGHQAVLNMFDRAIANAEACS